jgi:hypothetical protein
MKFMLLLYTDEAAPPVADLYQKMNAYREALAKAGVFIESGPMQKSRTARTLRPAGGALQVHDGPYADTREQFGGFFVIDAADMDEAEQWARKCPSAASAPIEIRPYLAGF